MKTSKYLEELKTQSAEQLNEQLAPDSRHRAQ